MDLIRILLSRCTGLFRRQKLDEDLDEELRTHIDLAIEENVKRGLSEQEARTAALRNFGGVAQTKEQYRTQRGLPFLEAAGRDIKFGFRQLRKSPGFTIAAVLTLALGIGATAAMFSVIDAVVLRPLPYNDVNRIVSIQTNSPSGYWQMSSWPGYLEMRRLNRSFDTLAGYEDFWGMTLKVGDETRYLNVDQGTDNFFDVFGVRPLLGRTFISGEDQPGKNNVVVLSYEVWRQSFSADRQVIGKVVNLDGEPYVVIGVMPAGFRFPFGKPNLVYIPMHVRSNWVGSWRSHWLMTLGRLKPGVSVQQAGADMAHVMQEIGQEKPDSDNGRTATLIPISTALRGSSEVSEIVLMLGAVLAVLLIACANVAGLLLARGIAREREMALRVAIGAARGRLVRQLLVESTLLGAMGAGAGILLAGGLLAAMKAFLIHSFMRGANITLNLEVMAVTLGLGVLSSVGAGLIPAWRAAKADPNKALKSGATAGTTRRQHRLRAGFVVTQIALSLMLLVFSGMLLLTLHRMLRAEIGFNPNHLLTLQINIPSGDYAAKGQNSVLDLLKPLEERVREIPGVTAAGINEQGALLGYGGSVYLPLVGQPPDPPDRQRISESRSVTPGYYAALGTPILRGRNFGTQDTPSSQPVAIVNEAWVREFLMKGQDPLTHAFQEGDGSKVAIVGVVADARQDALEPARPEIDFPISRESVQEQRNTGSWSLYLYVRTAVPPLTIVHQLRKALHDVGPTIAFQQPETMDELLSDAVVSNRMESWVFGIFAFIAVLLVAVGIYGLLMQEVISHTRDIGVRMALGATRTGIAQLMLTRITVLLGIGLGAGLLITLLLRRVVGSVVVVQFERDGVVIVMLVALLTAIGLLAAVIPMRRAASIDPMRALRSE
ncbi:MAG TPA: ABC transporter permease [Terracidiphilus sp.]|jgi:predicted permease